jgi:hypothetical protein
VLVEDVVVLDVGAHRQWSRELATVEEHRCAGNPLAEACAVQLVDERA